MTRGIFPNGNSSLFKKGCIPWSKGKSLSEETKNKISESKKGMKMPWVSERNKKYVGKSNHNYKGESVKVLTPTTVLHRKLIKKPCEKCGVDSGLIHHIDRNKQNNKSSNLMPLCYSCHAKIHKKNENFKAKTLEVRKKLSIAANKRKRNKKGRFGVVK